MDFINHTPFPAQDFGGVDQHDQEFHVVALRQTLTWGESAVLTYAHKQLPLCEEDHHAGPPENSYVLQESDYCQYKPRCDVIVNATAYAPQGKPTRRFRVKLVVRRPNELSPVPPRPEGINQFVAPSVSQLSAWETEMRARTILPGEQLLSKQLDVCGERYFVRRFWPIRAVAAILQYATLGLMRLPGWRLTTPLPAVAVPVNKQYAFGGRSRVNTEDKAAGRIAQRHRLPADQIAAQPDGEGRAVAHVACAANPAGRGYVRQWLVDALRLSTVRAPQVSRPDYPVGLGDFTQGLRGKLDSKRASSLVADFGVRPKSHPERIALSGTVDESFANSAAWLPLDFDFAMWNAAEPDQQIDYLQGDEVIELTNLCAPGASGARSDEGGNTTLALALPENECHVLVRLVSGEMFLSPMQIDTLIVEPDQQLLHLVWRVVLAKSPSAPIRAVEARMYSFKERDRIRAEVDTLKQQLGDVWDARATLTGGVDHV
ncbi:DUF2169 domain-containing protein [Massilia sp. CCM 8695]|uniref:DUF2169 domain-containing protein n=1 Tax=Massilia frigida TaxID=2609281 RepID=A0ABX0NK78_9BURK|nr:DUF2169 domain-containing protein [Massilia frigida]NHZ83965.1 DUF2169 domain-containing protein [Massilia frigida]